MVVNTKVDTMLFLAYWKNVKTPVFSFSTIGLVKKTKGYHGFCRLFEDEKLVMANFMSPDGIICCETVRTLVESWKKEYGITGKTDAWVLTIVNLYMAKFINIVGYDDELVRQKLVPAHD